MSAIDRDSGHFIWEFIQILISMEFYIQQVNERHVVVYVQAFRGWLLLISTDV